MSNSTSHITSQDALCQNTLHKLCYHSMCWTVLVGLLHTPPTLKEKYLPDTKEPETNRAMAIHHNPACMTSFCSSHHCSISMLGEIIFTQSSDATLIRSLLGHLLEHDFTRYFLLSTLPFSINLTTGRCPENFIIVCQTVVSHWVIVWVTLALVNLMVAILKQLTWLRIVQSGNWCLRLVIRTPRGACQKRKKILKGKYQTIQQLSHTHTHIQTVHHLW